MLDETVGKGGVIYTGRMKLELGMPRKLHWDQYDFHSEIKFNHLHFRSKPYQSSAPCGFNWSMQQANASYFYFLAAFAVQYVGLILDRWFFFAQDYHPQNLCCQTV